MRNHLHFGPVTIRVGSKHLASWGYPRLSIRGLSFWSWTNSGDLQLAAYHPRNSITWLWYVNISRRGTRFTKQMRAIRRRLYAEGNPHAPKPRWWHRFLDFEAVRRSQWHDYVRLPFGFQIVIGHQAPMWRRQKATPTGEFLPDWRERVISNRCPVCPGELDTGWECNDCGFDARIIALTEGSRPHA